MRQSHLFYSTLKENPRDATTSSQRFLMRAGYISQLSAGIWTLLPLGWRTAHKIMGIIREELNAIGAQELMMPAMHPKEIWMKTGRWKTFEPPLFIFRDRHDKEYALGPTHEEVVTDLARRYIRSYKQLPLSVYHFQTKFRNEQRSTGGLLRVREFIMKDLYSFHADDKNLDDYYESVKKAYLNIFHRCGVEAVAVEAPTGSIGGSASHEFMVLAEAGEDTIVKCTQCSYAANRSLSRVKRSKSASVVKAKKLQLISTGSAKTIQQVSDLLRVKPENQLKAVFHMKNDSKFIITMIRGDQEVNEDKLCRAVGADTLRLATPSEISSHGFTAGSASPIGLRKKNIVVVADISVREGKNFVMGANQVGKHYKNANYPRDFTADHIEDVALAKSGDKCLNCGAEIIVHNAIEAAHIFKLGTLYSQKMNSQYIDAHGKSHPLVMGCYGIGIGRLLATIAEANHDTKGLVWPRAVSPYHAHLIILGQEKHLWHSAELLHDKLGAAGIEVLWDDRSDMSAGEKFAESDLLGIPVRLIISRKTENMIEVKLRRRDSIKLMRLNEVIELLKNETL